MEYSQNQTFDVYHDIMERTKGEIYIGVVGPVRTGKSTFIKSFMEEMILPAMTDQEKKQRATDELPQSANGKTITTTEPKFVPNEAAKIVVGEGEAVYIRLIDCVGYMVKGAVGHMEQDEERMVKTPWSDVEIPFTKAAQIGTDRVISKHSTIGLVITTDASFTELSRESYIEPEEKTIQALKKLGKPFIVLVNSAKPYSEEARGIAEQIEKKYGVTAMTVNCKQMKKEDIHCILERVLYEFPVSSIEFYMQKWVEMLPEDSPVKVSLIDKIKAIAGEYRTIRDVLEKPIELEAEEIKRCKTDSLCFADGVVKVSVELMDKYYYEMLSNLAGEQIDNEYQLVRILKDLSGNREEYEKVGSAVNQARASGYGVIIPKKEQIHLEEPELIKHGNKYGVKIKATAPSIHMIRANIETEIAPIVGTKQQADDLIGYIADTAKERDIWDTHIFGKSVEQLITDGISAKIIMLGEESQLKLQDTMQKIVNDSNGGMVCIII